MNKDFYAIYTGTFILSFCAGVQYGAVVGWACFGALLSLTGLINTNDTTDR